jgi:hypothetical protein
LLSFTTQIKPADHAHLIQSSQIPIPFGKVEKSTKVLPFPDVGEGLPNFLAEKVPKTSLSFHK